MCERDGGSRRSPTGFAVDASFSRTLTRLYNTRLVSVESAPPPLTKTTRNGLAVVPTAFALRTSRNASKYPTVISVYSASDMPTAGVPKAQIHASCSAIVSWSAGG